VTDTEHPRESEVGSVAEEAAKLFGALNGWARDHSGALGESVADLSDHAAAAGNDINEHLATGSAECTVCPVCRTVHAVRQLSPEVKAHLATAATSLMHAAAGLLATAAPAPAPDRGGVEHIDLDAANEHWPEDPM
jgi:hypothetical protein